jgi:hypothetical protein
MLENERCYTMYECEICGTQSSNKKMVENCEKFHSLPVSFEVPAKVGNRNPWTYGQCNVREYPHYIEVAFANGQKVLYKIV